MGETEEQVGIKEEREAETQRRKAETRKGEHRGHGTGEVAEAGRGRGLEERKAKSEGGGEAVQGAEREPRRLVAGKRGRGTWATSLCLHRLASQTPSWESRPSRLRAVSAGGMLGTVRALGKPP